MSRASRPAFPQQTTQTITPSGNTYINAGAAAGTIVAQINQQTTSSSSSILSLLGGQGLNIQNSTTNRGTTISLGTNGIGLRVDTTGDTPVVHMADGIFSIGRDKDNDTGKSAVSIDTLIFSTAGISCTSDERLKTDIKLLDNALYKINKLKGVTYTWKDGHGCKEIGVIAQDIKAQFPELVHQNKDDFFTVDYSKLTAVLIEGIKEMSKEIDILKNSLKEISAKKPRQRKVTEVKEVKEENEPAIAKKPRQKKVQKDE
jgi:hypothetical protein